MKTSILRRDNIDLDKDNHIVGIEILDASEKLKESLSYLEFSEIPSKDLNPINSIN